MGTEDQAGSRRDAGCRLLLSQKFGGRWVRPKRQLNAQFSLFVNSRFSELQRFQSVHFPSKLLPLAPGNRRRDVPLRDIRQNPRDDHPPSRVF